VRAIIAAALRNENRVECGGLCEWLSRMLLMKFLTHTIEMKIIRI
jgi:hypothetical protein